MSDTESDFDDTGDGEVAMLCRRCGDGLLDFQESDDGMQGWCDACGEWVEPSSQPDEWDEESELEYDISDLDHGRRVRLVALLDDDGTPFVWDPDHVLVVAADDEEDVDAALDAVGVNPDVAFAPPGAAPAGRPAFDSSQSAANGNGGYGDDDEEDEEDDDDDDDEEDDDEDDDDDDAEDWEESPLDDDAAEALADALEELAVVVRQVRRDPNAGADSGTVSRVYSLVAGSPAPYGYTDQHWSELIAATAALARAVSGGKASDRTVAAARLQRVLPGA